MSLYERQQNTLQQFDGGDVEAMGCPSTEAKPDEYQWSFTIPSTFRDYAPDSLLLAPTLRSPRQDFSLQRELLGSSSHPAFLGDEGISICMCGKPGKKLQDKGVNNYFIQVCHISLFCQCIFRYTDVHCLHTSLPVSHLSFVKMEQGSRSNWFLVVYCECQVSFHT